MSVAPHSFYANNSSAQLGDCSSSRRVVQHSSDNKMGSSNLALVFGPTLTRAPDNLDPRQLHNDVPTVNMLIQV